MKGRAERLLEADQYARTMGIRLVSVEPPSVTISMTVTEAMNNFHGGMHGGALFSLADCAFSLASNLPGDMAVAIDTHLVLSSSPAVGEQLTAVAEEVHRGRTLATYRVMVTRPNGRVAGHFTGTVFINPQGASGGDRSPK
ncbi:MAG TPA: hotdog fold thioesterase [Acidimicrobiia bacterium]|nr:hotdog fold thioesterase [Acidimicrobiia bacterium]